MIDLSKLKELVALMSQNDLSEVALKDGDEQITIRRGGQPVMMMGAASPVQHVAQAASHAPVQAASASTASPSSAPAGAGGSSGAGSSATASIDSPMVGTFYSRPNPTAESFVKVGDHVTPETVVCIIEAMKVFNEIQAEVRGRVVAILCDDETPVEFGKPLLKIDTNG